jgi:hypothetical protein
LALGVMFPFVHRPLHAGLDGRTRRAGAAGAGPEAVAQERLLRDREGRNPKRRIWARC